MFTIDRKEYGIPDHDRIGDRKIYDARRYTLARLFPKFPSSFEYVYDFGDWWEHTIEIECEEAAEYRKQYPICADGAEPCPPEDVSGPPGYQELLTAIRDPAHPQHDDFTQWAKAQLYSGRFRVESRN
jgi:hypothetical protein